MRKAISVQIDDGKLSAIEMYLEQKSSTLTAELEKYIEQLYGKIVPQNVRDYIEMLSAGQKPRKRRSVTDKEKPDQQDGV